MLGEQAEAKELFPTARELFDVVPGKGRVQIPLFAWLIAGAIVVLAGQRIVYWIDRNL
ncbi:MAG TPA: hypothetical protein VFH67_01290 [bacterium]|nr:hypothetical protein [bacterium]